MPVLNIFHLRIAQCNVKDLQMTCMDKLTGTSGRSSLARLARKNKEYNKECIFIGITCHQTPNIPADNDRQDVVC